MEHVDCIVIGAGVIGLAVGRELALRGREVIVLEAEAAIGQHASSRNTGVIHAGLHYPPSNIKARLCRQGRDLLYSYCAERDIAHRRLGKLITAPIAATEADIAALRHFQQIAIGNGCDDLVWLERDDVRALEPELDAPAAILSPSSGIVDQTELMLALWGDLSQHGGQVVLGTRVVGGEVGSDEIEIATSGPDATRLKCAICVNAAGFDAPIVARALKNVPEATIPQRLLQKGCYFVYSGRSPFSHLIYPHHHGMHTSLDVGGQLRFGPDFEWVDQIDYSVDESRSQSFYNKIREFWPALPDDSLTPGWAAVRPKIGRESANQTDFMIHDKRVHGAPGLVNLFGIESPGLTSCLAIAREVASRLEMTA